MSETAIVEVPDATAIEKRNQPFVDWATALVVGSTDDCVDAEANIVSIDEMRKTLELELRPGIAAAHTTHKTLTTQLNKFDKPLADAKLMATNKTRAYRNLQERKRRDEENRLREVAKQQEEDRRLAQAADLEAEGQPEAAEEVISQPVHAPVVVVQSAVPKPAGVRYVPRWTFRVTAKDKIPYAYLIPNEKELGALARSLKGEALCAGVDFYDANAEEGLR